ncbi:MAG: c-type cytochrome [Betaproteobacteria bacterium]|nr:c-type cytochrome [Betaproteobacteria bacterium]
MVALALAVTIAACGRSSGIDRRDAARVARGGQLYAAHCAACHGANLEGQPDWRRRLPSGRMPAPPHDDSGHTWHHPDEVLFGITREGLVPGRYAPPGYQSDMPAFGAVLSDDDIRAVLSFIQSRWSQEAWRAREEMLGNRRGG